MITLKLSEGVVLKLALECIKSLREEARLVGLFTRVDGGSARDSSVRLAHGHVREFRPIIQVAVSLYGPDLFRRRNFKSEVISK